MLVKFCNERKNIWDEHLDTCTFAYNTARHDSTKFSPFDLMFGRKAVLPVELETENASPEEMLEKFNNAPTMESNAAFFTKVIKTRSAILDKAKENIAAAQEKQRAHYNRKHANPTVYQVGSKVLVKDFLRKKRKEGKIDHRWLGPYVILKNLGKGMLVGILHYNHLYYFEHYYFAGIYLLQQQSTLNERRVNGSHIKPFYDSKNDLPDEDGSNIQAQKSDVSASSSSTEATQIHTSDDSASSSSAMEIDTSDYSASLSSSPRPLRKRAGEKSTALPSKKRAMVYIFQNQWLHKPLIKM